MCVSLFVSVHVLFGHCSTCFCSINEQTNNKHRYEEQKQTLYKQSLYDI